MAPKRAILGPIIYCLVAIPCAFGFLHFTYGWPIDLQTWVILLIVLTLPGLSWLFRRPKAAVVLAPFSAMLFFSFFVVPNEIHNLMDVRGGRRGKQFETWLGTLKFGRAGANTRLMEEHLGHLPAQWRHQAIQFMLWTRFRDGNERVAIRSFIFKESLTGVLDKLPSNSARLQVLQCLTDSENLLRVHQNLLLACLLELDFPPGYDSERWWNKHQLLFRQEYDPRKAAREVWGWSEYVQYHYGSSVDLGPKLQAAYYQENGMWGGDGVFAEAYEALRQVEPRMTRRGDYLPTNVVWWPSSN